MARTFGELKRQKTLSAFNIFCKDIAEEYAHTELTKATTYFTETYSLKKSAYREILKYAVVEALVSKETMLQMRNKAKNNQRRNGSIYAESTFANYENLRREREARVREIAEEYVDTEKTKSTYEFMQEKGLSWNMLRAILEEFLDMSGVKTSDKEAVEKRLKIDIPYKGMTPFQPSLFDD